jgi:hypothetical protein
MWVMQAHHIDTDYYDPFFPPRCLWIDPCGPHMVRAVPPTAS